MSALRRHITGWIPACIASVGFCSTALNAQVPACAEAVRAIYRRMAGEIRTQGSITRLRYTVRTTSKWQGKTQTTVSNVELIASDTRLHLISEQMELAQDATTAVAVLPGRRSIHISGSNLERFREVRGSSVAALRDSVFSTSDVTECTSRTDNVAGADQKVTFRLKPGPRSRFKMEAVTIYINTTKQTIQKIVFAPTADNNVTSIEIVFNSIEYNYTTDRFARPLLSQFIDEKGKALPKYSGYTVSDARKRSR